MHLPEGRELEDEGRRQRKRRTEYALKEYVSNWILDFAVSLKMHPKGIKAAIQNLKPVHELTPNQPQLLETTGLVSFAF